MFIPKIRFGFSLQSITLHRFCSFIDGINIRDPEFAQQKLDLSGIEWKQLINNSKKHKLPLNNPNTDGGRPLL